MQKYKNIILFIGIYNINNINNNSDYNSNNNNKF
jgi:hypothetical protein